MSSARPKKLAGKPAKAKKAQAVDAMELEEAVAVAPRRQAKAGKKQQKVAARALSDDDENDMEEDEQEEDEEDEEEEEEEQAPVSKGKSAKLDKKGAASDKESLKKAKKRSREDADEEDEEAPAKKSKADRDDKDKESNAKSAEQSGIVGDLTEGQHAFLSQFGAHSRSFRIPLVRDQFHY
jgi:hypothetical protein